MASTQPSQAFYALTLMHSSAPTAAVCCNVIPGLKQQDQQVFEARGSRLYLRRVEENAERTDIFVTTVFEQEAFSIIRGVVRCRIPGEDLDHIFLVTDSGRIGMYEFDADNKRLKQIHLETFGKSGVRRTVPGQYVAADPTGRCIMMASTEKNKVVYVFQRTPQGVITISSPHEANSWGTLTFDICGLDTGWENPVFAALEVEYPDIEADETGDAYKYREKVVSFYTVDLGLNHVVKTWSDTVDYTANKVFGIPGAGNGPSGVIVCALGRIYYRHSKFESFSIQIPRRRGPNEQPDRDRIIVAGTVHVNKSRADFFYLLQTDDGDVFKLTMQYEEGSRVPVSMELRYYETFSVASQMLLIRKGYLYLNAEQGPTKIYHVDDLAENPEVEPENVLSSVDCSADPNVKLEPARFQHRGHKYVTYMMEIPAMHPLIKTRVDNIIGDDANQILSIQGSGNKSSFKLTRHGQDVHVDLSIQHGGIPRETVWSLKDHVDDEHSKWIVVNSKYADKTMILMVDGEDINGVDNTVFLHTRATVLAALMGIDTKVQVHARGVRTILANDNISEWTPPHGLSVACGGANQRQLLLGLSSGELAFFFMTEGGILSELQERPEMSAAITAIGLGNTPEGKQQARFGVVGCEDLTVRVLSIELDSPLEVRSIQAVTDVPVSIVVVDMLDPNSGSNVSVVHIGLRSGVYLRAIIDEVTGELSEVRSRFLGAAPTRIFPAELHGQQCVILCSSKPWIGYHHPVSKQYTVTPLITPYIEAVCQFSSVVMSGLCGVAGTELRFFGPTSIGQKFVTEELQLPYTPRAMTRHPSTGTVYVVSSDANTMSEATAASMAASSSEPKYLEGAPLNNHRAPQHWASAIQAMDAVIEKKITCTIYLDGNEAALCCNVVQFESRDYENFLIVGTGRNMSTVLSPNNTKAKGGFIHVYSISEDSSTLKFEFKNEFPHPIHALVPFKGRMAVGIGDELCIYDLGTQNVLRKARGAFVPNKIVGIEAMGNRLVVSDVRESVTYVHHKEDDDTLIPFVDDTIPRWTTCASMLDYETTAGGDKFGNLWIVRCPESVSQDINDINRQNFIINDRPFVNGTPYRLDLRAHYFTQDIPTTVVRTSLVAGGQDVLFWSGIQGTMGILVPFVSRRDVDIFTKLETALRTEDPPLAGRDHLAFRSSYAAVRSVIDGDLCERFLELTYDQKQRVAAECDRSVSDIEKKVQEMRTRVAF